VIGKSGAYTHAFPGNRIGTLYSWGLNNSSQLAYSGSSFGANTTPRRAQALTSTQNWSSIASGSSFGLGILSDGSLYAWGSNADGQCGIPGSLTYTTPTQIGSDLWASVACGGRHSLGIKDDGTLWAWGARQDGVLGISGLTTNQATPALVSSDSWTSVAASAYNSFAIKSNGTLWGWGMNIDEYLMPEDDQSGPINQIGSATWSKISASMSFASYIGRHFAGIQSDGTLWTWGYNTVGQLGDGTQVDKLTPTQIGSDTWNDVAARDGGCIAIKDDGTLWAWGSNTNGQVGDGTTTTRFSPVVISSETWSSVAVSAAIKSDNTLWTWGYNLYGTVGDGTTQNALSPVRVSHVEWEQIASANQLSMIGLRK